MIAETIKAVKDAESAAEEIVAKAKKEALDIIRASEEKADDMEQEARRKAADLLNTAALKDKEEGEGELSTSSEDDEKEVALLKKQASDREEQAVSEVIKALLD